jgi:hypothetical protein
MPPILLKTLLPLVVILALAASVISGQSTKTNPQSLKLALDSTAGIEPANGQLKVVDYRGRRALQLVPLAGHEAADDSMLAVLTNSDFKNGVIELEVAGAPRKDAAPNMKGFIGLAFRLQEEEKEPKLEMFYIRPSNARLDDQLARNHSVQYVSEPGYGWQKLRADSPGVYESYADLETGAWTKLKIVVSGAKAQFYVNGATQPCLVVNDLKQGESHGKIALWAHSTTEAYFSRISIQPQP